MFVQKYVQQFRKIWWESDTHLPQFGKTYSKRDKFSREACLEKLLNSIESEQEQNPPGGRVSSETQKNYFSALRNFFKSAFDFEDDYLDVILSPAFIESTKAFIKMSRCFDQSLSMNDIFQASRNVWIMNGLQQLLGLPVELTPAIFAYSMLYPYSDNYLDNPGISKQNKNIFNKRLSQRLAGKSIIPDNSHEQQIFNLIAMIEEQYDRSSNPQVFESLLAIHQAQIKSLRLFDHKVSLSEEEVLMISIEKGGASVLADGYLVAGSLTEPQRKFLFGYGAHLQLLDDLQDVQEDCDAGLLTIFSRASRHFPLDAFTNRTFHFGKHVMNFVNCFTGKNSHSFLDLIKKSINLLIIEAVGLADGFYSKSYSRQIETYSPFHFSVLKKRQYSLSPFRLSLMKSLHLEH